MGPPAPLTKAEILREIQFMMKELFELGSDRVQPGARLIEDLELDSIDAIDLAVKVEETTGLAFDETVIRQLRTVEDVIVAIEGILGTQDMPAFRSAISPSGSASQADPSKQTDP